MCYLSSLLLLAAFPAAASDFGGSSASPLRGLPFALILLSITFGPLFFSRIWHHHFDKITAFWTLLFLTPFIITFGFGAGAHAVAHALVEEYISFILLLLALYIISGGIFVSGDLHGSPKLNTTLLTVGTVLPSIMGTTGAAVLMIHPLLKASHKRHYCVHIVIFFIFLVANIGGGLTPLDDPPLFLGFLRGIDFMWTVKHILMPVLISSVVLLTVFYIIDSRHFNREQSEHLIPTPSDKKEKVKIYGKWSSLLLAGVIGAVLLSGLWKPNHPGFEILGNHYASQSLMRDGILLALTAVSWITTPKQICADNEFNSEPTAEVGKLFLGIFITISPVLAILKTGEAGALGAVVSLVHDVTDNPINVMYFWMSGILSAFLDNAPTYLVFFNMTGGDAQALMAGHLFRSLLAVSMGSVFMDALTYVGNAPNSMVRAIAEQRGVPMPSFFGYMAWSVIVSIPLLALHTMIFFVWQLF